MFSGKFMARLWVSDRNWVRVRIMVKDRVSLSVRDRVTVRLRVRISVRV